MKPHHRAAALLTEALRLQSKLEIRLLTAYRCSSDRMRTEKLDRVLSLSERRTDRRRALFMAELGKVEPK